MKKVVRILILLLVSVSAVLIAASCGKDCFCDKRREGSVPAYASDASSLYVRNDPSVPGGCMYSNNGVDFYQLTGDPVVFVNTYCSGLPEDELFYLYFGEEGSPICTLSTITITRNTIAEIYLFDIYASSIDPLDPEYAEKIAGSSAIAILGSSDLTIRKGDIATDGARAITHQSAGTLVIDSSEYQLTGYDTRIRSASPVATILIEDIMSDSEAYLQYGGSVFNSSDDPGASVVLNASGRNIYVYGGILAAMPSAHPEEEDYIGYGFSNVIRNLSDGSIHIEELQPEKWIFIASSNTRTGVISLNAGAEGNILLSAAGAEIVNRNTDVLAADTAYTVFSPGTGNIILVACDVAISAGTAIYKTQGQLSLEDSYIASGYGAAIVAQDIRLTLINCRICSESSPYGALHLAGGTIIADSSQFSNASAGMLLTLEEQFLAGFDGRGLQGNNLAIITAEKENESIVLRVSAADGAEEFFRCWQAEGGFCSFQNPIALAEIPSGMMLTLHMEPKYALTPEAGIANGAVTGTLPASAFAGDTMTVFVRPDSGYYLQSMYYFSGSLPVSLYEHAGSSYDFSSADITMPAENIVVTAVFSPIPIDASMENAEADYPDSATLAPSVTAFDGIVYFYTWYYRGRLLVGQHDSFLTLTEVDESGLYTVIVTNSIGAEQKSVSATATIRPYPVPAVWESEPEYIFNGALQGPSARAKRPDNTDLPIMVNGRSSQAGEHTLTAVSIDTNYILTGNTTVYRIEPLGIFAGWGAVTSFEYNGFAHSPDAQALDIDGNPLEITIYGSQINASATPYVAHAVPDNRNYFFTNADKEFTIYPKAVTPEWSFDYTDDNLSIFFYTGFDQIARISAIYRNIFSFAVPLSVSVVGEQKGSTAFSVPDTYLVTADFLAPSPNYTLAPASTRVIIYPAKPVITIPQNDVVFLYDGSSHSLQYSCLYTDESLILFKVNNEVSANSFVNPGVYSVVITSETDEYHDAAPPVTATVRVLRTMLEYKNDDGVLIASAYNAFGVDPLAELVVQSTPGSSPALDERYTDAWGRTVLMIYNLTLSGSNAAIEGNTVVRLKVGEEILANRSLKLCCFRDGQKREVPYTIEDGFIVFTADALGEYVLTGDSLMNSVIGLGIIVFVTAVLVWVGISSSLRKRRVL
jgi:hypothetical protein